MSGAASKSVAFRREREPRWRRLEMLVDKAERGGVRRLSAIELIELPKLYRAAISGLSVARAISLDKNLVEYLEALSARAYCCVYASRGGALVSILRFLTSRFPRAVRAQGGVLALAATALVLGLVLGWTKTAQDPELYYAFMEPGLAQGRDPLATTPELEHSLYPPITDFQGSLGTFAAFLFTHNTQVALLAFAFGIVGGIPILPLLFTTGASTGALAAVFQSRGLTADLWAWLLPHGITELLAICIAGAAGLAIGKAMLFPRSKSRFDAVVEEGRRGARLMIGVCGMLFIAGMIEGIFRQVEQDIHVRYSVAALTACFWASYFGLGGRARPEADDA